MRGDVAEFRDIFMLCMFIKVFSSAYSFDQPLSTWDVGRVTNMHGSKCPISHSHHG
jgi:surface protein